MGAFILNLDPGDAARVVEKLQENQIAYLLAPGGRTIMVEPHLVDQARLTLAREKVVPGSGVGFMDLFATRVSGKRNFSKTLNTGLPRKGNSPV